MRPVFAKTLPNAPHTNSLHEIKRAIDTARQQSPIVQRLLNAEATWIDTLAPFLSTVTVHAHETVCTRGAESSFLGIVLSASLFATLPDSSWEVKAGTWFGLDPVVDGHPPHPRPFDLRNVSPREVSVAILTYKQMDLLEQTCPALALRVVRFFHGIVAARQQRYADAQDDTARMRAFNLLPPEETQGGAGTASPTRSPPAPATRTIPLEPFAQKRKAPFNSRCETIETETSKALAIQEELDTTRADLHRLQATWAQGKKKIAAQDTKIDTLTRENKAMAKERDASNVKRRLAQRATRKSTIKAKHKAQVEQLEAKVTTAEETLAKAKEEWAKTHTSLQTTITQQTQQLQQASATAQAVDIRHKHQLHAHGEQVAAQQEKEMQRLYTAAEQADAALGHARVRITNVARRFLRTFAFRALYKTQLQRVRAQYERERRTRQRAQRLLEESTQREKELKRQHMETHAQLLDAQKAKRELEEELSFFSQEVGALRIMRLRYGVLLRRMTFRVFYREFRHRQFLRNINAQLWKLSSDALHAVASTDREAVRQSMAVAHIVDSPTLRISHRALVELKEFKSAYDRFSRDCDGGSPTFTRGAVVDVASGARLRSGRKSAAYGSQHVPDTSPSARLRPQAVTRFLSAAFVNQLGKYGLYQAQLHTDMVQWAKTCKRLMARNADLSNELMELRARLAESEAAHTASSLALQTERDTLATRLVESETNPKWRCLIGKRRPLDKTTVPLDNGGMVSDSTRHNPQRQIEEWKSAQMDLQSSCLRLFVREQHLLERVRLLEHAERRDGVEPTTGQGGRFLTMIKTESRARLDALLAKSRQAFEEGEESGQDVVDKELARYARLAKENDDFALRSAAAKSLQEADGDMGRVVEMLWDILPSSVRPVNSTQHLENQIANPRLLAMLKRGQGGMGLAKQMSGSGRRTRVRRRGARSRRGAASARLPATTLTQGGDAQPYFGSGPPDRSGAQSAHAVRSVSLGVFRSAVPQQESGATLSARPASRPVSQALPRRRKSARLGTLTSLL